MTAAKAAGGKTANGKATPSEAPRRFDALRKQAAQHRSTTILITMLIGSIGLYFWSAFPPFSFMQQQNSWIGAFVNAGVFMLLASGLNIVVGMAGLLDLGYAAFFAFGVLLPVHGWAVDEDDVARILLDVPALAEVGESWSLVCSRT